MNPIWRCLVALARAVLAAHHPGCVVLAVPVRLVRRRRVAALPETRRVG